MKKLTGVLLVMMLVGVLGGCASTCCQQPAPCNMKGEG